jgi:hypothetical protein
MAFINEYTKGVAELRGIDERYYLPVVSDLVMTGIGILGKLVSIHWM